jgi:hypothetical protein
MDTLQPIFAIFLVLGLLAATLWWLRRRGLASFTASVSRKRQDNCLRAMERLALSPTHTLHLVRAGDRAILLACSQAGAQVIETAPWSHYQAPESQ